MTEFIGTHPHIFRSLAGSTLIIGNLFLLLLAVSILRTNHMNFSRQAKVTTSTGITDSDSCGEPNVVTCHMAAMTSAFGQTMGTAERRFSVGFGSMTKTTAQVSRATSKAAVKSGKAVAMIPVRGGRFVAREVTTGASFMFHGAGNILAFTIHAPGKIVGIASATPTVSSVIRPADNSAVPIINALPPPPRAIPAVVAPVKPANQLAPPPAESQPIWPIHGTVTTEFGVPHWPYQPTHTGLDISDGRSAGVTPVKAFKPGHVIEATRSYSGYGNHVIIDHGGGITSLYGHLASMSVQVGQAVDQSTAVGLEGSTGASTGTHLHFEIRLNGQPVNPLQYVNGRP